MNTDIRFDFMGKRSIALAFSAILLIASLGSFFYQQLQFGLDFTGGTLVEVVFDETVDLQAVRQTIADAGYQDAVVQKLGTDTDVAVRLAQDFNEKLGDEIREALEQGLSQSVELRRSEYIGAQVGEELREDGGMGMLMSLVVVMFYVAIRFQFKFSVGAVAALTHDVIIVLGVFSIMRWDFDLTVLAALLAVIGYSLNDTIVVYDRIRENFRIVREKTTLEMINISLNQTLGRTVVTSLTTLLVLFSLLIVGGENIKNFALALIVGVIIGTYSSIFVAANVLVAMKLSKEDLMVPVKEGVDLDDLEQMP